MYSKDIPRYERRNCGIPAKATIGRLQVQSSKRLSRIRPQLRFGFFSFFVNNPYGLFGREQVHMRL